MVFTFLLKKAMPEFIDLPTSSITETDIITEMYGKDSFLMFERRFHKLRNSGP